MKVKELIWILKTVDQELPIATSANSQEYFSTYADDTHGALHVSLCHHYAGDCILIGNQWKKDLNAPNWYILKDIVGKTRDIGKDKLARMEQ